jgi:hypothetical protein
MPNHLSHGFPYIQPERHDEMSDGVAAPRQADTGDERRANGTLVQGASIVPAMGGRSLKGRTSLSHRIDATALREPNRRRARSFRRAACSELARDVGGGVCGVVASALVKLAAEALALSEQALEDGDLDLHRKLAESSRMHLVYAREHCAKAAVARRGADSQNAHAALLQSLE